MWHQFINWMDKVEKEVNTKDYTIYLENDVISVKKTVDEEEQDSGYFQTAPYDVLWEILAAKGFNVEEG